MTDYEKCGGALWEPKRKVYSKCLRCGKTLRNSEAQIRGYGKICWSKQLHDTQNRLF